jgi:hypothetical protein
VYGLLTKPPPSVRTRVLRALALGPATQLDLQKTLYPNGWTVTESAVVLDALRVMQIRPAEIEELVDEDLGTLKIVKYALKKVSAAPSRSRL